ncbi:MAG: hypothetical protein WC941_07935 [Candidatus Bathyarchaeia archaeon]
MSGKGLGEKRRSTGEHRIERIDTSTPMGKGYREFLDEIDSSARCEKCGGLPYDIVFSHKGALFKFCLYKIERDGKILAETDYEKLHEYTKKGGAMMSTREKKKAE